MSLSFNEARLRDGQSDRSPNDLQLARVLLARVAHVIDTRAHVAQTHVAFSLNAICVGNSSGDHFKSVRNAALCIMKTCLLLPRLVGSSLANRMEL